MSLADFVSGAQLVAHTDAYFVMGGSCDFVDLNNVKRSSKIGRLDYNTLQWSLAGQLASSTRKEFGAIFDGTKYVIVGGDNEVGGAGIPEYNENCVVNDKMMTCTEQQKNQAITSYSWPLLFLIDY